MRSTHFCDGLNIVKRFEHKKNRRYELLSLFSLGFEFSATFSLDSIGLLTNNSISHLTYCLVFGQ